MESTKNATYCYYCQENFATKTRSVPMRRKNGYKLIDFKVELCEECNSLDNKFLSDYFSI